MVTFPNCKINIGLHVVSKRPDGFHDLETIFYPLPLHDALEIISLPNHYKNPALTTSGLSIEGTFTDNICVKAWRLLRMHFPQVPAVAMHIHKAIPMGAGLGGGSADGAFMLRMLNDKYQLQLTDEQLTQYALQLGSDCPFFILNQPCIGTGRGEILQPLPLNLGNYYFVLIHPGIHVHTGRAFGQMTPQVPAQPLWQAIGSPVETWKDAVVNDFEKVVFLQHPEIASIKEMLYQQGAVYASMTGSGSTVFGLFATLPQLPPLPKEYFVKIIQPTLALP